MNIKEIKISKYLTLEEFCTCTQTYHKYAQNINPYPQNISEVIPALQDLNQFIIDPIIDYFGREQFRLTYGFCSPDLKKYLEKKDPVTGQKNGRVAPNLDQHISYEINKNGKYYCARLGAACDFMIINIPSEQVIDWILQNKLPFDSLYFYSNQQPIHISYGIQHKRDIWTFNNSGIPTKKGIEEWIKLAKAF
ncbi:hypothetical protein [Trichormus variabilis]|uniref:Peptidase M15A C-terminal domain-containing protein n=1 Tax=Trichormus variabilis SAG 1403-4b TaxID=447716 RepID=A0A433UMQ3_ANAVA|nr:hypothetical protein [Trichormus variabilis]MBD2624953.1 hypothetical protein [Trichormus variabilis FACHB-164]RUS95110.1 hypothetical protein DSM107003_33100 [Trichormus variabilis SAG 1403-4b]